MGDSGVTYPAGTPYSTIFSAGTIPTADINPVSAKLLQFVPAPNKASVAGGPLNEYSFDATRQKSDNQYLYRVDQKFRGRRTGWQGYLAQRKNRRIGARAFSGGGNLPGYWRSRRGEFQIHNGLVESRAAQREYDQRAARRLQPLQLSGGVPRDSNSSFLLRIFHHAAKRGGRGTTLYTHIPGLFNLGFSEYGPQPRIDQVYQANDNFALIHGRHTLKFGFDMRRWQVLSPSLSTNSGAFFFEPYGTYSTGVPGADFLLGLPAFYEQASGGLENARTQQYYGYAQDQFQLRSNVNLTFGLGWTIDTPMLNTAYNGHGQLAFRPGVQSTVFPNAPLGVVYSGDPGIDAAGPTQWRNLGPRVGIAYSPDWGWLTGGAGKTSIRAGYGIYYDKSETEQAGQVGFGIPPFAITTVNGVVSAGAGVSGVNPGFAKPFTDVANGSSVPNPYPFNGYPSNVNFATTPGLLPIYTPCCASAAPDTKDPRVTNYNPVAVQRGRWARAHWLRWDMLARKRDYFPTRCLSISSRGTTGVTTRLTSTTWMCMARSIRSSAAAMRIFTMRCRRASTKNCRAGCSFWSPTPTATPSTTRRVLKTAVSESRVAEKADSAVGFAPAIPIVSRGAIMDLPFTTRISGW